jgi:nucleoprotein TPR
LSSLLESRAKEQTEAKKDARKWEGQAGVLQKEDDLLRQQLRDLSVQIAQLLDNDRMRKEGMDPLTAAEEIQRERIARGDTDDERYQGMTSTGRWISENLVVFQDTVELQSQNAKLLRLTRELGDKMEEDERRRVENSDSHQQQHDELVSLRQEIAGLKDELQAQLVKTSSITKERDMFRTMIQNRRQSQIGQDGTPDFSQSVPMSGGIDQGVSSQNNSNLAKMFKDLTQHFDNYRNEASADTRSLKQQADTLAAEKSKIQSELGRSATQLTLANERYEMLQANLNMLKTENVELQKRSTTYAEGAAKQDLRSQQLAEELVEAKSMADSTRNEMSNLKAEKDLSKKIEKRLSEDNEALMNERSRLNTLITNLQNLQNEREHSDAETRRKLQARVESLELELQSTKRKLSDEVEDGKKAALRREYDHQQNQQRIDDLVASLGTVREDLVAARTTRDHLQVRNDELAIELKSAEERVQLLQPRPTPRAAVNTNAGQSTNGSADDMEAVDREQELAIEVSELKRDLELTRSELENAKTQVEQYKAISQSSEEELQSLNETQDQYREEMERLLEEKNTRIRSLEQRSEDLAQELSSRNDELSLLHSQEGDRARKVEEEKAALEVEIARLRDDDERHATAAQFHQEDLKAQAEIAQQAQQNYENELVKHAEAAQALQKIRTEYNTVKVEVVELRTETEAARSTLAQNESNWEETKQRYEAELAEMRTRREDVNSQNRLLHQQLESVSTQITALKQRRSEVQDGEDVPMQTDTNASDRSVQDLREVIRYLRREKDIVDVQYELSIQESKRMKQQLDYAQSQLDEARLKLDQERRTQADQGRSSIAHNQLMDKINELNLFRESNTTLRNEVRQAQTQLAEKSSRIDELLAQIQPMDMKVRELENTKELSEGELKILQEDRDRWQQRTQTILSKYDRIDPAEMDALKEKLSGLESERDGLLAEKATIDQLNEQIAAIPEQIRVAQEEAVKPYQAQRDKLRERAQNKINEIREEATAGKNQLEQQLSEVKQELENTKKELDQTKASISSTSQQIHQSAPTETMGEDSRVQEPTTTSGISSEERKSLQDRLDTLEATKANLTTETSTLKAQRASELAKIADLESQVVSSPILYPPYLPSLTFF